MQTRAEWIEYSNQLRRRMVVVEERCARLKRKLAESTETLRLFRAAMRRRGRAARQTAKAVRS